jgi:hypothetical protein
LRDAPRVLFSERPTLPECGELLGEERVRVGDGLVEGARESLLERVTVTRPEDAAEERVDGTVLVAGAVVLDRWLHELAAEGRLQLGRRRRPRGVHRDDGVHGVRGIEGQLERDRDTGGVADDVCALDSELTHEEEAVPGMVGHRHRPVDELLPPNPPRW